MVLSEVLTLSDIVFLQLIHSVVAESIKYVILKNSNSDMQLLHKHSTLHSLVLLSHSQQSLGPIPPIITITELVMLVTACAYLPSGHWNRRNDLLIFVQFCRKNRLLVPVYYVPHICMQSIDTKEYSIVPIQTALYIV